ncbi:hypothetical protein KsCSTR_00170 [Candidatus Kuenenia stuttgartiensis]|jgi:cbb3-type cytochrome oxidase subunit 3|uniref:Cbb3-type cytochrome oxidase component FixQ n=1 Tax=Kuenenia stuttgartiensis TaxID=174633 RepID=Q1PVB5_KUEST|nr:MULTISPECIES: CcoQ/FixQ family Cbb3-type cytochrome c oxidase assembly chaperone [Kuenenia]MBE7545631.1 CcoQ/FixQ family Cbb3-type cytochrome c oxidase assembly chaperone [Planctomycetia bacterium]MBW7943195.1 CcoQ/FixQ family Cbb3-type cytochrome c oxidase assembly chaperone [Candidatus Kuenenia stuttgartiensis]MBZ0192571.1 CcoQ/FixQ family Cbb3-type cytochrome c oxidase assembly chaperone [Candidatus Kuenenia stuttgartiensis]MCF6153101.1 CcoQ/FixQ family Cbb3-type cytochrome c oxidase asse
MKQQALAHFTDTYLAAIGFFLFFFVFLGILFWIQRKGAAKHYDYMSHLPLREEERS